jgi:predicted phage baseplate assembly protein
LHQTPLTYLAAANTDGAVSTLAIRVNDVQWHEADNLFVLGPMDRQFTTQTDDAGTTTVVFGNGRHGLRVPTGTANVKAAYRSGSGRAGNVDAQQISQLATQPLGLKGVINPLPATGGAEGDTRDQARRNVPIGITALDRLVSVQDYTDFTRRFAGIGKADARRLTDGRRLLVHVTIAGKDDIPIDTTSDLYHALVLALAQAGDASVPVQIALRRLKVLVIAAGVKVKADYLWESVADAVRSMLLDVYSFEHRELGQTAFLSEAVSAIQSVRGVEYVDMRTFDAIGESVTAAQLAALAKTLTLKTFVQAELAHPDSIAIGSGRRIAPAELVILTPDIPDTLILNEITT